MEQKLGRYTIEEPLGEGSFAQVYRAFDQKLKRLAAPVPEPAPAPVPVAPEAIPTQPQPAPHHLSRGLGAVTLFCDSLVLLIMVGGIIFGVSQCGGATPEPAVPVEKPTATEALVEEAPPATEAPVEEASAVTEAPLAELPQTITAPDGVTMVLVPAGPFEMGDDADVGLAECKKLYFKPDKCERSFFENEEPKHTVTLDDFYIDQYEVTNAQYAVCVDDGACDLPSDTSSGTRDSYYGHSEYDDHPVIWVNWEQAKTYCEWRGARLPTEAEWEKAARGTDGRLYPWGNSFDGDRVNFCDSNCILVWANADYNDRYADTAPIGSYSNETSPYGVHDMAGNVWEWVADWYDENYYSSSPAVNPTGPASGESRVVRGGAWDAVGDNVRAAYRSWSPPAGAIFNIGFRCARSP